MLQKYRAYYKSIDDSTKKRHYEGTQTWIGLHPQALQTPYCDIYKALSMLKKFEIKKIIDIGSGYGRVGHVMNSLFPKASFVGYEVLEQRQREGNRIFELHQLLNCKIELKNVLEEQFELPKADIYFIYDFSEMKDLSQILTELSSRLINQSFFLIVKGERINYLLANKFKEFWLSSGYLQAGDLKIYSSRCNLKNI